jgi:DNA primase
MIDQTTISKIFETADIVEVISEFVQLKKSGTNFKGLSPFSTEKTPSFFVSPSKGIYKDFSSGKGGNVVGFLMEHEKLTYPEALKYLAKKYNIEISEKERTAEEILVETERESLQVVSNFAHKFFIETIHNTVEGKAIGLKYLKERGIREDIIEKFQLGYSPEERDALTKTALKNGFKIEFLVKAGVSVEKNDYRFDRFNGRVIFPIHSLSGNVIGFGGRILRSDKETAKYLNSPESEIYHKSKVLYGLYFARKAVITYDKCFLVEGYTDVLAMHQAGIENVVATSGTALTTEQIRLIKRFTQNITIIYDGDDAGIKASFRGIDLVLEEGLNVRVLLLPDKEDPDSFARNRSSSELKTYIDKNEQDFISFKTGILLNDSKNDPVKRGNLIQEIVRSITMIQDEFIRSEYIKECSVLLQVNERVLHSEVRKQRINYLNQKSGAIPPAFKTPPAAPVQPSIPDFVENIYSEAEEKEIIYFLLKFGNKKIRLSADPENEINVATYIIREIINDELEFKNLIYKKIFEDINRMIEMEKDIDGSYFIYNEDESIRSLAVDVYTSRHEISKVWERKGAQIEMPGDKLYMEIPKALLAYKSKILMMARDKKFKEMEKAQKDLNENLVSEIQKQINNLDKVKVPLNNALGQRVILP